MQFEKTDDKKLLEDGTALAPRFGPDGLITAVVTDATSGELLMLAHMNGEALSKTIETGEGWYWSRSRRELWHKGDTSGAIQDVVEMRIDCDQDAVWLKVRVRGNGGTCHTGRQGCFYRRIVKDGGGARLEFDAGDHSAQHAATQGRSVSPRDGEAGTYAGSGLMRKD